jgi:hypothetical protein
VWRGHQEIERTITHCFALLLWAVCGICFFLLIQVMGSNNGFIDFQRQNIELCRYGSTVGNRQWEIAPSVGGTKMFSNFQFQRKAVSGSFPGGYGPLSLGAPAPRLIWNYGFYYLSFMTSGTLL